jgi:hypothetical protein
MSALREHQLATIRANIERAIAALGAGNMFGVALELGSASNSAYVAALNDEYEKGQREAIRIWAPHTTEAA